MKKNVYYIFDTPDTIRWVEASFGSWRYLIEFWTFPKCRENSETLRIQTTHEWPEIDGESHL